jgi:Transposase, Mutator family
MRRFDSLSGWNRSVDGAASQSAIVGSITEQAWPHPMLRLSTDLGFRDPHVANFWVHFHKTIAYFSVDLAPSLRGLIRTTNLLERFHKEVRRKQRDIGMFQSEHGCEVIWYLLATRESAKQQAALQNRP